MGKNKNAISVEHLILYIEVGQKNLPIKVQLGFDVVLKKVAELLYVKFYAIFAPRRQIIKRKKQDKR